MTRLTPRRRTRSGRRTAPTDPPAQVITIIPPPETNSAGAATLWTHLSGLLHHHRGHVAFEYSWTKFGVHIGVWVPASLPVAAVAKIIEAAWPGAHTTISAATAPLPGVLPMAGGRLRTGRADVLPIRADHDADPLRAIFAAAHPHDDDQHAIVQILARPAPVGRLADAVNATRQLNKGRSLNRIGRIVDAVAPKLSGSADHPERSAKVKAAVDKAAHPRFEVCIRYAASDRGRGQTSGQSPEQSTGQRLDEPSQQRAAAIAAAFALFTGRHNWLRHHEVDDTADLAGALATRRFDRGDILSVPELAALAHLPLDAAIPGLVRAGARSLPPPPAVPAAGPDRKTLGEADAGAARTVALPVRDVRHHVHVIGATGSGKTTLLTRWILQDAAAGRGVVAIDGKGDQINDILDRLPLDAADRVVIIDPAQPGPPPGINVLTGPDPYLAVDHLVGIFHQMYADSWGPRTDDILRAACLTLATRPGATLADIPRLLADSAYRARVTAGVSDTVLRQFWTWYDQLSKPGRAAAIGPVQNKLRALLLRPFVRAVIAQPHTSVDLGDILDGGLLLARIPKGELGADTVRLLGSFILTALWEHATHRSRLFEDVRRDAAVYVDELHNYLNLLSGVEDLLAEARAFRLGLILAHQDLAQIPRALRESLSANARTKIIFSVSPEDGRALERHVHPNLTAHDLTHLDAFQGAARLVVDAATTPAFTFRTQPLPPAIPGRAKHISQAAAARQAAVGAPPAETAPRSDPRRDPRRAGNAAPPTIPPATPLPSPGPSPRATNRKDKKEGSN